MEQVFKTKWVPDWQYVGMGVAILVVIVIFFWLQEWTALGGLIVPLMLFYSQSKTIYTIKDSGVLEVKSVWGKRFCGWHQEHYLPASCPWDAKDKS